MLVLTRKKKEALIFTVDGHQIVVRVLDYRGNGDRVSIGITADKSVRIIREELEVDRGETL